MEFHYPRRSPSLMRDVEHFFVKEEKLIESEVREKSQELKIGTMDLIATGVLALVGTICLAITAILFLGTMITLWKAAGIVTILLFTFAGILYGLSREKFHQSLSRPTRSLDNLDEFKQMMKGRFQKIMRQ